MDLQRKQSLPSNKLATVMAKFDEMKTSGKMMPTATLAVGTMEGRRIVCWRKLIWLSLVFTNYYSHQLTLKKTAVSLHHYPLPKTSVLIPKHQLTPSQTKLNPIL